MKRQIVIGEWAEVEIAGATNQFRLRSPKRAKEFLVAIDVVLEDLLDFPSAYAVRETVEGNELRRAGISRFDWALWYFVTLVTDEISGQTVEVIHLVGCRHAKQDKPDWSERLESN